MGSYREQLLKQTYGNKNIENYGYQTKEEEPSYVLSVFKIRFFLSIVLFAVFAWLSITGNCLFGISAKEMKEAIASQDFSLDWLELEENEKINSLRNAVEMLE